MYFISAIPINQQLNTNNKSKHNDSRLCSPIRTLAKFDPQEILKVLHVERPGNAFGRLLGRLQIVALEIIPQARHWDLRILYHVRNAHSPRSQSLDAPPKHSALNQMPAASFHWLPVLVIAMKGRLGVVSIVFAIGLLPCTHSCTATLNRRRTGGEKVEQLFGATSIEAYLNWGKCQ